MTAKVALRKLNASKIDLVIKYTTKFSILSRKVDLKNSSPFLYGDWKIAKIEENKANHKTRRNGFIFVFARSKKFYIFLLQVDIYIYICTNSKKRLVQ